MCGISGIINPSGDRDLSPVIRRINTAMAHRGPDAEEFYLQERTVALGHRRLSILDLSTAANQPYTDASGRYVMVYNGEIYNFAEIKPQLACYPFKTTGDTEVVIAAYAKWGPACLDHFKGMFALAIWDREDRSLFMARDRFGVKPLYYAHVDGQLLFASEIRALLASGQIQRRLNRTALTDYLKYQSFVSPLTPVQDILQLPAGSYMFFRDGRLDQTVYWDVARQHKPVGNVPLKEIQTHIRELLYRSVERRLVSDVPLGAFLSGGIDSSIVVAIMSEVSRGATNAFTIAFEEKEYNELPYAEMIARKFGVHHSAVLLKPSDFLERLPDALNALDTPSGDGLNTYIVSHAIKKSGITVALSGVGGDELFAGYPIFCQFQRLRRQKNIFDHTFALRKLVASGLSQTDQRKGAIKYLLTAPSSSISDIYPAFREIQNPYAIRRLTGNRQAISRDGTLERSLKAAQGFLDDFGTFSQVSIADYIGYTQSVLLKDMDQMSMSASLETREPFFDHDLVEYVLNIPDVYKQPDYPKKLLVESMNGLLPPEVVFRKKQGFVLPYDFWIRNELRAFCTEKIRLVASLDFFSEEAILKYWEDYLHGRSHIRWTDIWILIVLGHWLEKNEVG
jgi:asparagine synthase (glutamine-hydrolysing)